MQEKLALIRRELQEIVIITSKLSTQFRVNFNQQK